MTNIPLTKLQLEIMREFYSIAPTKVLFNKKERQKLWSLAVKRMEIPLSYNLKAICPALYHQIQKSYEGIKNIQPAVFSECVYAQTFANLLNLKVFVNCFEDNNFIPKNVLQLLKSYHLFPRYVYSNDDKSRILIQAGGCNGIDSALISIIDLNIYTIEFKEPGAKTSEPDLPKYKEDGRLLITDEFIERYPQFEQMMKEHIDLNFFEVMGNNIHNFSAESINIAVTNNYAKKYADVVCTEDKNGYLVMLPVNQVSLWAQIEGEIRPAGRNHYNVWTPNSLKKFIKEKGGIIDNSLVTMKKANLGIRKERGGAGKISGYKINPLFFIYLRDCIDNGEMVEFDLNKVQQLNPTIAGKMFFKTLKYNDVKKYYFN